MVFYVYGLIAVILETINCFEELQNRLYNMPLSVSAMFCACAYENVF